MIEGNQPGPAGARTLDRERTDRERSIQEDPVRAYTRIALATVVVAAAACTDDPVARRVEHIDEPTPAIVAAQQQPVDDVADHFRARLDIEFEVDGELSPGTPITVHLEGTAEEDITSAEISVALPTFDIMENGVVPGGKGACGQELDGRQA